MRRLIPDDTIAAIATAVGESGIGIVRMSGKGALAIADTLFLSRDGKKPSQFKTHTVHYGWIVADRKKPEIIDEVLLTVMRTPRTYTKEDIVEINCHGGAAALGAVLKLVLANGSRLAEPGEFTRRAFLNGRIDLAQAEAVLDIIRAKTDSALTISVEQLKGRLSQAIKKIREEALGALALLEASIDFPEEELGEADLKTIGRQLESAGKRLAGILEDAHYGRCLREGIHCVICGRPNVGKSSLLNALLKQERSIVTPVPGTTRDTIEEVINIKGIPVRIVDTAGIVKPKDPVSRKAVLRSKQYMRQADLAILVFDGSRRLSADDETLIKKLRKKPVIAVINKIDLQQSIQKQKILKEFPSAVSLSAKKGKNMAFLEDAVVNAVGKGRIIHPEAGLVSNLRHIEKLKAAQKFIVQARHLLDNTVSVEFIAQDLKDAVRVLDEMLGLEFSEDLLDRIFNEFCIGK
jgi:tRNA modification GTPase